MKNYIVTKKHSKFLTLIPIILLSSFSFAQDRTEISYTSINQQKAPTISDEEHANFWNVSDQEWAQYQKYMELEGKFYYQNVSPLTVLAIIEKDQSKRNIFLAKHVVKERDRVKREVSVANDAWRIQSAMYGNEKLVDFSTLPWADSTYTDRTITIDADSSSLNAAAYSDFNDQNFLENDELVLVFDPNNCGDMCNQQIRLMLKEQPLNLVVLLLENNEESFEKFSKSTNLEGAIKTDRVRVDFYDNESIFFESKPKANEIYHLRHGQIIRKL